MDYVDDHADYDTAGRHNLAGIDEVDVYKAQFYNWPERNVNLKD